MARNLVMDYNYFDIMAKAQKGYARLLDPICKKWDLTRNEVDVLLFLYNNPDYDRAVDIVNNRGLSKSHVSLSISGLEEKGMLIRLDDPSDRRTVHLKLTEQGRQIADMGRNAQTRFFSYLHQGVTQEQLQMMVDFTKKVSENIRNIDEVFSFK